MTAVGQGRRGQAWAARLQDEEYIAQVGALNVAENLWAGRACTEALAEINELLRKWQGYVYLIGGVKQRRPRVEVVPPTAPDRIEALVNDVLRPVVAEWIPAFYAAERWLGRWKAGRESKVELATKTIGYYLDQVDDLRKRGEPRSRRARRAKGLEA